jgi:glucose-1-phosphate thymidylyltransferase
LRCIIPAAGRGTRLRPHTHTKPKALLQLGNQPIIGHIVNRIIDAGITDIIVIVGFEKEKLIAYLKGVYSDRCKFTFVEQEQPRGLGHAIYVASEYLDDESVLIALGDSIYENPFKHMIQQFDLNSSWDGALTIKEVPNPQAYGIVITDPESSVVTQMIEKPESSSSNKAITGIYIIKDSIALKDALETLVKNETVGKGGELQLTDALQIMVNKGSSIGTIDSGKWFDCGKKESLLEANKFVLSSYKESQVYSKTENSIIIHPVAIQTDCHIANSIIGPYVSIDRETTISRGIISSSIIGTRTNIKNVNLHESVIGDEVNLLGGLNNFDIGDQSDIILS